MKKTLLLLVAALANSLLPANCQVPGQPRPPQPDYQRSVSWKELLPNIGNDQREIWTFPARIHRKRVLIPTLCVLATTAGLVALDPVSAGHFRNTSYGAFNSAFNGTSTAVGIALIPALFYTSGAFKHDTYAQHSALLAGEAVADSEIADQVFKRIFNRSRPTSLPANSKFGDTWFEQKNGWLKGNGGFPSGHAVAAFSVATVMTQRYRNHKWVPWVAYGLAGLVSFSRMSTQSHFGSDVFFGAALGYSITRFTVLRQ